MLTFQLEFVEHREKSMPRKTINLLLKALIFGLVINVAIQVMSEPADPAQFSREAPVQAGVPAPAKAQPLTQDSQ
jgi:hypothetical protein